MRSNSAEIPTIHLGVAGRSLNIALLGRPYPDADEAWDRDLIDARVTVHADPFRGAFTTVVWSHDLRGLLALMTDLHARVGGAAEETFAFLEQGVRLVFRLGKAGGLTVDVALLPEPASGPSLEFNFTADQSYLPGWIADVQDALAAFPL